MYQEAKGQVCEWTIQVERITLLVFNFQRRETEELRSKRKKEKAQDVIFIVYGPKELCVYIGININDKRRRREEKQHAFHTEAAQWRQTSPKSP